MPKKKGRTLENLTASHGLKEAQLANAWEEIESLSRQLSAVVYDKQELATYLEDFEACSLESEQGYLASIASLQAQVQRLEEELATLEQMALEEEEATMRELEDVRSVGG